MTLRDHYLSARSRGWDYSHSIRYALDRAAEQLARSFDADR